MRFFVPQFLKSFDRWMLLHFPIAWRAGLHYFFFYSFLTGNILLLTATLIWPVNPTNAPGSQGFSNVFSITMLIGLFFILLWVYVQIRRPLGDLSVFQYFAAVFMNVFCLFSIYVNGLASTIPLVIKTAKVIPDQVFSEDYAFHESHRFWNEPSEADLFRKDSIVKKRIKEDFRKYGLNPPVEVGYYSEKTGHLKVFFSQNPLRPPSTLQLTETSSSTYNAYGEKPSFVIQKCLIHGSGTEDIAKYHSEDVSGIRKAFSDVPFFENRLNSIQEAKLFRQAQGAYYRRYIQVIPRVFGLISLVSCLLVAVKIPGHKFRQLKIARKILVNPFNRIVWNYAPLEKLDKNLALNKPVVWATRIHKLLINSLLTFLLLAAVLFFAKLSHLSEFEFLENPGIGSRLIQAFYYLFAVSILIGLLAFRRSNSILGYTNKMHHLYLRNLLIGWFAFYLLVGLFFAFLGSILETDFRLFLYETSAGNVFYYLIQLVLIIPALTYLSRISNRKDLPILFLVFFALLLIGNISLILNQFENNKFIYPLAILIQFLFSFFSIVIILFPRALIKKFKKTKTKINLTHFFLLCATVVVSETIGSMLFDSLGNGGDFLYFLVMLIPFTLSFALIISIFLFYHWRLYKDISEKELMLPK